MAEISDDELEQIMRQKLAAMASTPASENKQETAQIAKLLGTKTAAEHFLRHARTKPITPGKSRANNQPQKRFRPLKVRLRYDYFDQLYGGWMIEQYENGALVKKMEGSDYRVRDTILRRIRAGGGEIRPITVSDIEPRPIVGAVETRLAQRQHSAKKAMLHRVGSLTAADLAEIEDFE